MTLDAEQINKTDIGILEILREGRSSPRHIASELGKQQPYISQRLKRLVEHGHVERVDRGLYQLTSPPEESESGVSYRRKTLEVYGEECVECGATEGIEVHHINRDRDDNRLENLIPLCRPCHRNLHTDGDTTTYQFEVDDGTWARWKDTVPRSKNLDERLRELVVADTEGRVLEPGADDTATESVAEGDIDTATPTPEAARSVLEDVLAGSGDLLDRRVDEALAMYDHLREEGAAKKSDLLEVVDVGATGYDSAASVWANMAKGKFGKLPGVEAPPTGKSTWRYQGGTDG